MVISTLEISTVDCTVNKDIYLVRKEIGLVSRWINIWFVTIVRILFLCIKSSLPYKRHHVPHMDYPMNENNLAKT